MQVQILTKNNELTIGDCLSSLRPLNAKIIIGDLGSSDNTLHICRQNGTEIRTFYPKNMSVIRNTLSAKGWNMFIQPNEFIIKGHDDIKELTTLDVKKTVTVCVIDGNALSKEIRIWSEYEFTNPVYETLYDEKSIKTDVLFGTQGKLDTDYSKKIMDEWVASSPLDTEASYYEAMNCLKNYEYNIFIPKAKKYLLNAQEGIGTTMMRYYLAVVQAYQTSDLNEAIKHTLSCIAYNPLMAEFWCLLGDIHCKMNLYLKAVHFYENAMILGSQRRRTDSWSMDVMKYKEYPEKMINLCKTSIQVR